MQETPFIYYTQKQFEQLLNTTVRSVIKEVMLEVEAEKNSQKLLTIKNACERLQVSPPTVFKMLREGILTREKIKGNSRKVYIKSEELDSVMKTIKPYNRNI